VDRPYDTIEESDETPVWGCAATVERPYDTIEESDETPA
jgi:hypothetical protein